MLPGHDIRVANLLNVRLIVNSINKNGRNNAHLFPDLHKNTHISESYLPPEDIRLTRYISRNRHLLT
ncbi:MAG: hypothetical protein QXQ46_10175 [Thermoplasmatales archaeon]